MKTPLMYIFLIFFSSNVLGDTKTLEIKGTMFCELVDSVVIAVEDGTSKRFAAFTEKLSEGDSFLFQYIYQQVAYPDGFVVETLMFEEEAKLDHYFLFPMRFVHTIEKKRRFKDFVITEDDTEVWFSKNEIRIETPSFGNLSLKRYHKGDWNGVMSSSAAAQGELHALDCKGVRDEVNEIFTLLVKNADSLD
jgi:hypothetical protein